MTNQKLDEERRKPERMFKSFSTFVIVVVGLSSFVIHPRPGERSTSDAYQLGCDRDSE